MANDDFSEPPLRADSKNAILFFFPIFGSGGSIAPPPPPPPEMKTQPPMYLSFFDGGLAFGEE